MGRFKVVNNVKIPLTAEEEKARDAEETQEELNRQEYLKVKYKDDREKVYPAIGDQLDALYHAGVFPKEMADKIKAVKDANPKP
tara:strand:- start:189 stop:440 length:252 start_codon:yes stop_codon:yes gene_type:complete